jgi:NAD dependent epimerase/dehydratase family enzyme
MALRAVLGEMADMILTGQRVVPAKLLALGYRFRYPALAAALASVV